MQSDFAHAYTVHLLHAVLQNILQNMRELEAMSLLYYVPSAILEDALNKKALQKELNGEKDHLLTYLHDLPETKRQIHVFK